MIHQTPLRLLCFPALIAVLLITGCGSTLRVDRGRSQGQRFDGGDAPVFVTNPQMEREFAILRTSGVYRLTNHPAGARQLTLKPMRGLGACGNPLMLTGITFGLIPGVIRGDHLFEYELAANGTNQHVTRQLPLYRRVSIWEHLVPKHETNVFAEALACSRSVTLPAELSQARKGDRQ